MTRLLNALPTVLWLLAAGFAVGALIALRKGGRRDVAARMSPRRPG